jgi:phosphonate dehydrogenase
MPKIVVTNKVFPGTLARLEEIGDVVANQREQPLTYEEVRSRAADADAVLAFMPDRIDAGFLAAAPRLRVVACALKGFDNFDLEAASRAGVWVSIVPDLLTNPTAELGVGLAIALARKIRDGDSYVRANRFDGWRPMLYGTGLDGSTVTIVGMGAVGRAIARRLSGFACKLIGIDPAARMPEGVQSMPLHDALSRSDYVFVAAPLTGPNRHLIGNDAVSVMRRGALLINVGRGSVVHEAVVARALENGALGGYAADVFEFEDWALPDRPRVIDPRLLAHPNALFTPHLGSAVASVRKEIELRAAENIVDVLSGRVPRDAINEPATRHRLAS